MPNATARATALPLPQPHPSFGGPTRRGLIGALAVLGAAPLVSTASAEVAVDPALFRADDDGAHAEALWNARMALAPAFAAAWRAYRAAEARVPWWARRGPACIDSDGRFCGEDSFVPADPEPVLPAPGARACIRFSGDDARREYRESAQIWGMVPPLRRLKRRLRRAIRLGNGARGARAWAGVDAADARLDALEGQLGTIDDALAALDPTNPRVAAALMLRAACADVTNYDDPVSALPCYRAVRAGLPALRPHLAGALAAAADELGDEDRLVGDLAMVVDKYEPLRERPYPETVAEAVRRDIASGLPAEWAGRPRGRWAGNEEVMP